MRTLGGGGKADWITACADVGLDLEDGSFDNAALRLLRTTSLAVRRWNQLRDGVVTVPYDEGRTAVERVGTGVPDGPGISQKCHAARHHFPAVRL